MLLKVDYACQSLPLTK